MSASLTVHPKVLIDALAAVKPAVATRSAVQALAGVRVTAGEGLAELTATDMSISARRYLAGDTEGEMDTVVSHAMLAKAVGRFAKRDSVTLRVEVTAGELVREHYFKLRRENPATLAVDAIRMARTEAGERSIAMTVTDGQRTVELHGSRRADFPPIDFAAGTPWFDAPGPELAGVIARAVTFASTDETRPVLTGLYFEPSEEGSVVCATDSYRLGIFKLPVGARYDEQPANIPGRELKIALKSIKATPAVCFRLEPHAVHIRTPECDWRIRTIDGQYPNYRQLWPDFAAPGYADCELTLPVIELREACDTAVAFAQHNAPLRLNVNGGVKIHGRTPDRCSFTETLVGATIDRAPADGELEIGLNPSFVQDIAKVANNGELKLSLLTPLRPAAWLDGEDRYLLMPIRLNV